MGKIKGTTTDTIYYWDDECGWIHISEKEKLKGAYERFKKKHGKRFIMYSSPRMKNDFFYKLYQSSLGSMKK